MASSENNTSSPDPPFKITLHWLEVSRAATILRLLEELKVPYELKTYKRQEDKMGDPKLKEIHPLGKSPLVEIESPATSKPLILAESGAIVEYLCDHFGAWLIPKRYQEGKEDQIGGETENWLRYRHFMHYAEGSIMPMIITRLLIESIKNAPVPFFIRPITNSIADKIQSSYLGKQFKVHYQFVEGQLSTSPDGGDYLCGKDFTAADILMSFPLEACNAKSGMKQEDFPKVFAYVEKVRQREGYQRAVQKIAETEGTFKPNI